MKTKQNYLTSLIIAVGLAVTSMVPAASALNVPGDGCLWMITCRAGECCYVTEDGKVHPECIEFQNECNEQECQHAKGAIAAVGGAELTCPSDVGL